MAAGGHGVNTAGNEGLTFNDWIIEHGSPARVKKHMSSTTAIHARQHYARKGGQTKGEHGAEERAEIRRRGNEIKAETRLPWKTIAAQVIDDLVLEIKSWTAAFPCTRSCGAC